MIRVIVGFILSLCAIPTPGTPISLEILVYGISASLILWGMNSNNFKNFIGE